MLSDKNIVSSQTEGMLYVGSYFTTVNNQLDTVMSLTW